MVERYHRRIFLRGLGGACVVAPFLGSIEPSARAEAAPSPRRLIAMFTHYGCITTRFFPEKSHGPLSATDLEGTTLRHLAPYVDKLLMPRGIRNMNEWTVDMLRGQGNDYHTQVVGSYFTCQPVSPNSDNPFDFGNETKYEAMPVGPSLDHVMAEQLSREGKPLFIRVANGNDSPFSAISYSAALTPYTGVGLPLQLFNDLTGLFQPSGGMTPDTYAAVRGKSVLDLVEDDLSTLERFDMSQADRNKLEAWKDLLHETEQMIPSAQCNQELVAALGLTSANLETAGSASSDADRLTRRVTDTLDGADLYSNLAVLAAVCNANPVIFLKYPSSFVYRGLGLLTEADSLAHRIGNGGLTGTCVDGVIDMLHTIDEYHAKKFAYLVGLLDSMQEGEGTALDNTAAVWFQEFSDGCAKNLNNMPIVQVGSCGGYFKTGWAVNVDDGSERLTSGNSEIVCAEGTSNAVDATTQNTGTDPRLANAPINKYYCNLMNALGVRAGADGFPARGGTQEVTCFGMYDKTEDFIGGGTNPPTIHDPGEFSELRAIA